MPHTLNFRIGFLIEDWRYEKYELITVENVEQMITSHMPGLDYLIIINTPTPNKQFQRHQAYYNCNRRICAKNSEIMPFCRYYFE
jgi:hypothetical protein